MTPQDILNNLQPTFVLSVTESSFSCFIYSTHIKYNCGIIVLEKDNLVYEIDINRCEDLTYLYWILNL